MALARPTVDGRATSSLDSDFFVLDALKIEPDRLVCYKRNVTEVGQKRCGLWTSRIRQSQMQIPLEDSSTGPASYVEMKAWPGCAVLNGCVSSILQRILFVGDADRMEIFRQF